MSLVYHERPGVYSSYDASSIIARGSTERVIALIGKAEAKAGLYRLHSYAEAKEAFAEGSELGRMAKLAYAGFQALGGTRVQYAGRTGDKIRATFRTAKQRLDDTKRDEKLLYVTYPGNFLAEPLDQAVVSIGALGIRGTFTVQEAQSGCDETGATCTLILR